MEIADYEKLYSILAEMKPSFYSVEDAIQKVFTEFEIIPRVKIKNTDQPNHSVEGKETE